MAGSTLAEAPEFLTARELADLLRVKERRVYDLAAAGEVPCARVTGKLLFPREALRAWLEAAAEGPAAGVARPSVFLGSHDPLLDWALRESGAAIPSFFDGSADGLARFAAREGIAAGLHLRDPVSGAWSVPAVAAGAGRGAVLVGFCTRRRGMLMPAGRGAPRLSALAGRRVIRRQSGSGAQALFAHVLAEAGLEPAAFPAAGEARSEADAALAVAEGRAEAAFGLEALAAPYGLDFLPLLEEPFDLLVDRAAWFEPPMQRFLAFCASPAFDARAATMPGHDITAFGRVRWNDA